MNSLNLEEIQSRLRAENLIAAPLPEISAEAASPWFVRILLGFCGWLAAVFLLGFVGTLLHRIFDEALLCILIGLIASVATVAIDRTDQRQPLLQQFTLALSLAGQALVFVGLFEQFDSTAPAYLLAMAFEVALVAFYRSDLQRFLCSLIAAATLTGWLADLRVSFIAPFLFLIAVVAVWLRESTWRASAQAGLWRPVAYALAIALFASALYRGGWRYRDVDPALASVLPALHALVFAGSAACLATLVYRLWRRGGYSQRAGLLAGVGTAGLLVAGFWINGLIAAIAVLFIGIARGNRILGGLALAFLVYALSRYYYDLHATLLVKSIALMGTGAGLLLARFILNATLKEQNHEA